MYALKGTYLPRRHVQVAQLGVVETEAAEHREVGARPSVDMLKHERSEQLPKCSASGFNKCHGAKVKCRLESEIRLAKLSQYSIPNDSESIAKNPAKVAPDTSHTRTRRLSRPYTIVRRTLLHHAQ